MHNGFQQHLCDELAAIEAAGLFKHEHIITTPQKTHIQLANNNQTGAVINLCSNNYLGLAQHPEVSAAAAKGLKEWGYGMASVRFICGTQYLHKQLEQALTEFLGTQDTILYPSCFDANGGLFETLLGPEDAIISDQLNHASIIDGIRLCKASRYRYKNNDMASLEAQLKIADSNGARFKLISTDGVFSMDGHIARLDEICDLAEKYQALVHFDDAHATGFVGTHGRGTHEYRGCIDRVDIITGTLGKALGGASGGYTSATKEVVGLLRQRSRPYLFSNTVAPPVVAGALKAIELVRSSTSMRDKLMDNAAVFREALCRMGFNIPTGEHPIIPVMLNDSVLAGEFAKCIMQRGVYVVAFSYPVVPQNKARIRTQMSADLTSDDLAKVIDAFSYTKKYLGI